MVSIMGPKECRVKCTCQTRDELKVFAARHKVTMGEAIKRLLHGGPWEPRVTTEPKILEPDRKPIIEVP
jgi:hypothetical protein